MTIADFPLVLANHTPMHTFVQFLGSPLGVFLLVGAVGIVAFNLLRKK